MARIFISHSSANNAEALALRDWLVARGWDDLFLDIDPHRGLVSGQRWLERLQASAQRCKAVLFVLSRAWLASGYCKAEFWEARKQELESLRLGLAQAGLTSFDTASFPWQARGFRARTGRHHAAAPAYRGLKRAG